LPEYIKKPEPKFERKLREKLDLPQGRVYDLHVASQVWQDTFPGRIRSRFISPRRLTPIR
jgi:hypothetical protein